MEVKKAPVVILKKESYLAMINNAVGTNIFRNLYALVDGEKNDIVENGDLSCAFFVSSILHQFHLITSPHATVSGLERDLKNSGWKVTGEYHQGDVIIWEPKIQNNNEIHTHAGFFIGEDQAISNSCENKTPQKHHFTFGFKPDGSAERNIVAVYTQDFLT
jgi:hypothetical protein